MADKLMESDIELLLVKKPQLIVDNPVNVERQVGNLDGTIDLLIEDDSGTTYIVELKPHRAWEQAWYSERLNHVLSMELHIGENRPSTV